MPPRVRAGRSRSEPGRPSFRLTYLLAAVLGIVQGLSEFLPISSTAHCCRWTTLGYQVPAACSRDDDSRAVLAGGGSIGQDHGRRLGLTWIGRRRFASCWSLPHSGGLAGVLLSVGQEGSIRAQGDAPPYMAGRILMIARFEPHGRVRGGQDAGSRASRLACVSAAMCQACRGRRGRSWRLSGPRSSGGASSVLWRAGGRGVSARLWECARSSSPSVA